MSLGPQHRSLLCSHFNIEAHVTILRPVLGDRLLVDSQQDSNPKQQTREPKDNYGILFDWAVVVAKSSTSSPSIQMILV